MERILTSRQKKNQPENDPLSQALNSFMMKDSVLDPNNTPGSNKGESAEKLNNDDPDETLNETLAYDFDESMASQRSIVSPQGSPGRKESVQKKGGLKMYNDIG